MLRQIAAGGALLTWGTAFAAQPPPTAPSATASAGASASEQPPPAPAAPASRPPEAGSAAPTPIDEPSSEDVYPDDPSDGAAPPEPSRPAADDAELAVDPAGAADPLPPPTGAPPVVRPPALPPDRERPADDDERRIWGIGVEATLLAWSPESEALSTAVGGLAGIYGHFELFDTTYLGLELLGSGAVGYNGHENWVGDVQVGVQPTVHLGSVGLSMVGGFGGDTVSGSDQPPATTYQVPSAIYGFFGGRLGLQIVSTVGLVGGVDQHFRDDDTVSAETRVFGGLRLSPDGPLSYRALFRYLHLSGADVLGGSLGIEL